MGIQKVNSSKPISISFYLGVGLKVVLSCLLFSYVLTVYFIPFVDYFIESDFSDPYQFFTENSQQEKFPYPALMLYILAVPNILLGWLEPFSSFNLLLYRLPLLAADITIFFILMSWLGNTNIKKLLLLYWFSPVLIYISFIHGQLDVIPISILFISLFFLFKRMIFWSAIFLGLAAATKTMVVLVFPFMLLFLLSKGSKVKVLLGFGLVSLLSFIVPNIPFIFSNSFFEMVFQNREQPKLFESSLLIGGYSFYLVPAAYILLLFKGISIKGFNRDVFVMFLAFSFGIILLFIPPMQGWYMWLIPFLIYFYSKSEGNAYLLLLGLQLFYLIYFALSENSDYFQLFNVISGKEVTSYNLYYQLLDQGYDAEQLSNLAFTALQTLLVANCLWVFQSGLNSYTKHKITSSPFLLGIGGNSGVGKTVISKAVSEVFQDYNTTILKGDDMHRWRRGDLNWNSYTHLDPKSNLLHEEISMLRNLKGGKKIYRRKYNHSSGNFDGEKPVKPSNLIIFEGLHPFYLQRQREIFDLKIFIRPSKTLEHHWKIVRDTLERGYSKEDIIEQIEKRQEDSENFIENQIEFADLLIIPETESDINEIGDAKEEVKFFYRVVLSSSVSLEVFLEQTESLDNLKITHNYLGLDKQEVVFKGLASNQELSLLAKNCITGLEDIGVDFPSWPSDSFGVLIMLITFLILDEADYDKNRIA